MKIQIHTTQQPDSDTTAFFLSCNRLHLLDITFTSFLKTRDYLTKIVMVDDSGIEGVFDYLVEKYGQLADIICFPTNRGLWWAKDFMVSFCDTEYIFYVEEDWKFLQPGYLSQSKKILQDHRHIGSIDISWRTFAEEGFESYDPNLIDGSFYYKKPWRISQNHLHWFIWQGSPNLKRREDLILLGRVEQFFNEWNIDRKFYALGYKGAFLNGRYVVHLGDHESIMVNKRKHEHTTPETLFPEVLKMDRLFPSFDYYALDQHAINLSSSITSNKHKTALVTCLLDIGRAQVDGRDFIGYYLDGLRKILDTKYPVIVYADKKYYDDILVMAGGRDCYVIPYCLDDIYRDVTEPNKLVEIILSESWLNQSDWIRKSIIRNPNYIMLTLHKLWLLQRSASHQHFKADKYFWIDSGLCHSYNIKSIRDLNLDECGDKISISSFGYHANSEIHGYGREGYQRLFGFNPTDVPRASIFGGDQIYINELFITFVETLQRSIDNGYIGTEESILAKLLVTHPDIFDCHKMPSGDITDFIVYLNRKI